MMWYDLVVLLEGILSIQSLYDFISFRGIQPVFIPAVWKLTIPLRIHVFLWLLSNNKFLIRGNLNKRKLLIDTCCLLCIENESICHLMFDCCIAKYLWGSELSLWMECWV
jgi:hypothetical protein